MNTRLAAVLAAALALPAYASEPVNAAKSKIRSAEPAGAKSQMKKLEPCCAVTAINAATGVATLRDLKSGRTFNVTVRNKARLNGLRVGQNVDKNL